MSIRSRIEDAKVLWENERLEGAAIQLLIAFAGTVRKRYPRGKYRDAEAFKRFIKDEELKITNGPKGVTFYYDGKHDVPVENIIYKFIRCSLIHEGSLPANIELTVPEVEETGPIGRNPEGEPYDTTIFNRLSVYDTLGFPLGWVWNLIRVIVEAPENKEEFEDYDCPVPKGYSFNAGLIFSYPDEHPERFPPNRPKN